VRLAAIDPGKRGAVVIVNTNSTKATKYLLKYNAEGLLEIDLLDLLKNCDQIIIEKIKGRGGWHANAVFKMGFYYGQVMHHLMPLSDKIESVLPEVWTGIIHRNVEKITGDNSAKAKTLRAYFDYFPHNPLQIKIEPDKNRVNYHDGLVDALMIAAHVLIENNEALPAWQFNNFGKE
jgi:hypothetical protein